MRNLLHVGCGGSRLQHLPTFFQDGSWSEIRYDINPDVAPDIVGELQDMSIIEDGSIDALYSSHNIEHVWAFEVGRVLEEFCRVLADDGFAMILCPDILSVCQAVVDGALEGALYQSPAGPISAIDIMYGHQNSIAEGNLFMAHKTAFTSNSLAQNLVRSGFGKVVVARDKIYGLHALAFKRSPDPTRLEDLIRALIPATDGAVTVETYEPAA